MSPKFRSGAKVFAKVRGFPPWPARIEGCADETPCKVKYHVYFYGTGETAVVKDLNVFDFAENRNKMGKSKKTKYFTEAMRQIESELLQQAALAALGDEVASPAGTSGQDTPKDGARKASDASEPGAPAARRSSATTNTPNPTPTSSKPAGPNDGKREFEPDSSSDDPAPAPMKVHDDSTPSTAVTPKTTAEPKNVALTSRYLLATRGKSTMKINLQLNRPNFEDNLKRNMTPSQWDELVLSEARSLKKRIESGDVPIKEDQINDHMDRFTKVKAATVYVLRSAEEEDRFRSEHNEVLSELLRCEIIIRSALTLKGADTKAALNKLDIVKKLPVTAIMLKKYPQCVRTYRKLRRYVGTPGSWKMTEDETLEFNSDAKQIRSKAEEVIAKFQTLFFMPTPGPPQAFFDHFSHELTAFNLKTKNMTKDEVFALVHEPQ